MCDNEFSKRLSEFKAGEKPEAILFVGDDPELAKVVLAWTNTTVESIGELTPLVVDSENEIWDWLWENTAYSVEELIQKSGLPRYGFEKKVGPLFSNRVLYPDGTINSFVQRYLREKVLKLFDAKPKRTGKSNS